LFFIYYWLALCCKRQKGKRTQTHFNFDLVPIFWGMFTRNLFVCLLQSTSPMCPTTIPCR
jgi:hypothetical protein